MKLVSKTNGIKTVELDDIELHLLTCALADYQYRAYDLTKKWWHQTAITDLYSEFVDIYCED